MEPDTPVSGVALNSILPLLIVASHCTNSDELNITANCVECIVVPSLIANSFCVWKSLPFLMNIVYSTTISPLPYPNVLIVDGEPALAVNEPERLVVIPIAGVTPVKFEPSPTKEVAVTTPAFPNFILLPTSRF